MKKPVSRSWQRLFFYLIINILVSACTTLTVLWLWERGRQAPDMTAASQALQTLVPLNPSPTASLQPTIAGTPASGEVIRIDNVIGAGNLDDEVVLLKRVGDGELDLEGWTLKNETGNRFTFPVMTLYPDGAVQVHTISGANTVTDLYWGRTAAAWKSGEKVEILDQQGTVRASYTIP